MLRNVSQGDILWALRINFRREKSYDILKGYYARKRMYFDIFVSGIWAWIKVY